jgi:murein DD-endopeptidase MepM/ murein hydrolase activator NlpD
MRPAVLRVLICVIWILIIGLVWLAVTQRPVETQITQIETPAPEPIPSPTPEPPPAANFIGQVELIIPVAGVRPEQLLDTFDDARSEGRVHDAIDIMAPAGTPVLAAAAGKIVKLFQSERGGMTIYQLSADEKTIYYYAHLQGYANGLAEGNVVRQGDVIAYVGDTGNAGVGNYHLHFSIAAVSDPKRYWEGTAINPYPLLRSTVR